MPINSTSSLGKWRDLPFKDKAAHITAICSFLLGWVVAFVGLFLPPSGEIDPTVISVFGIAVGYTGAMYGVINYIKNGQSEFYEKIMEGVRDMITQHYQSKH